MPVWSSIARSVTINCASARQPQTTQYSYSCSATKASLKWERSENDTHLHFYYPVWFIISILLHRHFLPGCEEWAVTVTRVWGVFGMRGMMKRPGGTSTLSLQLSSAMHYPPFSPNQTRTWDDKTMICWHHYSKFPPLLPLSLSPGTIAKPWVERSRDFWPESHSIPILLTLWRHLLSKSKL